MLRLAAFIAHNLDNLLFHLFSREFFFLAWVCGPFLRCIQDEQVLVEQ